MMGSCLGSLENQLGPHIQTLCVSDRSHLLPRGRGLFHCLQTCLSPAGGLLGFESLRVWIVSLRPCPTLALFVTPVILLEPTKPVPAYLTATGHIVGGLMVLIVGELLKLLLIERLFSVSRDKLMSIPAFAWCYHSFCRGQDWVASLQAWQLMRRWSSNAKHAVQRYVLELKAAQKRKRLSWRSR
jgi:hypothetical protein